MLTHAELSRHSRTLLLDEQALVRQQQLKNLRLMVVGLGGLGSPLAVQLAAQGVGCLHLVDGDTVALDNLPRQWLYPEASVGRYKAEVCAEQLALRQTSTRLVRHTTYADETFYRHSLPTIDAVFDCTDQLASRHALQHASAAAKVMLFGAAVTAQSAQRWQVDSHQAGCYQCVVPHGTQLSNNCQQQGVSPQLCTLTASLLVQQLWDWLDAKALQRPLPNSYVHYQTNLCCWSGGPIVADPHCPCAHSRKEI